METIHFKTVDPVSQDLLRMASQKGIDLNWERYEKQQPQDGFLRLGLSCPYGCMQGPCRIDPFGRGAERGICGLDRDGMVAAFLLRLILQGVLETMHACPDGRGGNEIVWKAPLDNRATAALACLGGAPLSSGEIFESSSLLARPSASPAQLVRQSLRLALLGIGLVAQDRSTSTTGSMECSIGYGLMAGEAMFIGVTGSVPSSLIESLSKGSTGMKNPGMRLVSLGDWIPAGDHFLPIACTSGEAETVLSSGNINLIVTGPHGDPGILTLCERMKIPFLNGSHADPPEILKRAREAFDRRGPASFAIDPALIGSGRVSLGDTEISAALKDSSPARIAILGGADTLLQSLGHLPVELAKALRGEGHAVASWGDAAIWMVKQDLPVVILDAREGPLSAVRALASAGKLALLKGICFSGLKDCRELAFALGLAELGMKVSLAAPIPLWGSEKVRSLLREDLAAAGGSLTHFDHPARAEELLEWFIQA